MFVQSLERGVDGKAAFERLPICGNQVSNTPPKNSPDTEVQLHSHRIGTLVQQSEQQCAAHLAEALKINYTLTITLQTKRPLG